MTRYYDTIAEFERDGFDIIVDKSYEDLDPKDCFDDECFNLKEMYSDIECGKLDWFMLRVRVMVENIELSSEFLGGCLYSDAKEPWNNPTSCRVVDSLRFWRYNTHMLNSKAKGSKHV